MALRFIDSFDHYATADIGSKWTTLGGAGSHTITANGRNGTSCFESNNRTGTLQLTLDAQATWIVGAAHRFSSLNSSTTNNIVFYFLDTATAHCGVRITTAGNLTVDRNGTVLGTGTAVLSPDIWYYIEVKVTISDTVGVAVVKVDGVTDINLSSQDTRNGGNASANIVQVNGGNQATTIRYDDLYICDGTGSSPTNDFLGDCRVEALFPNGNGNTSNLTGSDGNSTDNYLLVDETTPNTADYVESSNVGDKDTYAMTNLTPTSGTVYGVQPIPYAAKTDAGTRSIVSVARLSSTEVDSSAKSLSTTATYLRDIRETKPGGGSWSVSDVNSAEFGVKVNA